MCVSRRPVSYIIRHRCVAPHWPRRDKRRRTTRTRIKRSRAWDLISTGAIPSATMCKANYYYFECLGDICNHLAGGGRKTGSIDGKTIAWPTTRGRFPVSLSADRHVSLCAWPLNLPFLRRRARHA